MNSWLVGVVGVVVAGLIVLALMRLNMQAQERSVSATQQRAVRTSEMNLISMIEIDFQNIGSNHPAYDLEPDSAIEKLGYEAPDSVFRYFGQTARGMPPVMVEYKWHPDGTVKLERGTVPAYRVERWVDGAIRGMSSGAITRFEIELLDSQGMPVANTDDTRQVKIGLSMISNLGESGLLGETHWESIVRPTALARLDYEDYLPS